MIELTEEQQEEFDKMVNEIINNVLTDEHLKNEHTIDKKKHCPLCQKELNQKEK